MNTTPGRGWAYAGAALGGVVSIAANVAHSYVPPAQAAPDWSPEPGAVAASTCWPVFLLVAVEILTRTDWPAAARWTVLRYVGILPVALVAAFVSYRHLSGLLGYYGEDPLTAAVGPLAVDGLMVMATGALLATSPRTRDRIGGIETDSGSAPFDAAPDPIGSVLDRTIGSTLDSIGPAIPSAAPPLPAVDPVTIIADRSTVDRPPDSRSDPIDPPEVGDPEPIASPPNPIASTPDPVIIADAVGVAPAPRSLRIVPQAPTPDHPRARQADLDRARSLIASGELAAQPSAEAIRKALGISPAYARATRDALTHDGLRPATTS